MEKQTHLFGFFSSIVLITLLSLFGCSEGTIIKDDPPAPPTPSAQYYNDGESVTYQTASVGSGISLVFLGDGFTQETLERTSSSYMRLMSTAAEHFFDIEPFKTYRNYFNVYFVAAHSSESGITNPATGTIRQTCFSARYIEATGTGMSADFETCFEYALKSPMKPYTKGIEKYAESVWNNYKCQQTLIILVTNSTRYGGTTQIYSTNTAVSICPNSNPSTENQNFRGLIHHEGGGHGFAKLSDEYTTKAGPPSASALNDFAYWAGIGNCANVDSTNDRSLVKWRHFFAWENYSEVGTFEGGDLYAKGMWRPEEVSCMDKNMPYYNAPSREEIVRRILTYSGETFTTAKFLASDSKTMASHTKALRSKAFEEELPDSLRLESPRYIRIDPILP